MHDQVSDSSKSGTNPFVNLDSESPFDGPDDPDIQKTVQILPEVAEAMLAITEDQGAFRLYACTPARDHR